MDSSKLYCLAKLKRLATSVVKAFNHVDTAHVRVYVALNVTEYFIRVIKNSDDRGCTE